MVILMDFLRNQYVKNGGDALILPLAAFRKQPRMRSAASTTGDE